MNKQAKVALAIVFSAIFLLFVYQQIEIENLKPQAPNSMPTTTPTNLPNVPTTTPINNSDQQTSSVHVYSNTVYEWYLKSEFINNTTWLNETMSAIYSRPYNLSKTWTENYIAFISYAWVVPQAVVDSNIGGLVGATFIQYLPVQVSFNEATGFTRTSYQYVESMHYVIESNLTYLSDGRGWTKNFS